MELDKIHDYTVSKSYTNISVGIRQLRTLEHDYFYFLQITYRGLKSTFCCCYGDFCVLPEFNYTESVDKISITNDTFIRIDGNPPRPQANPAYTDWLFNGGLIAAGVLIIVIIIGSFIIAMKCKKKKETNRMTLAYRRIAADSTPDDEEDIKMLLG